MANNITQEHTFKPLSKSDYIAFAAMVFGMFMAVLDIQIVASSLSTIAAGLSATADELSWIQTSYMVAEAIVIPATGFLSRTFSTRISYAVSCAGFTIMSLMCSMAWNINSMIVFRALQGLFGGAMIPTVFGSMFTLFSPKQRPVAGVILGLVVTLAPTLGPTLGGYITEIASWRMMFLINLIPGIAVSFTVLKFANFNMPNWNLLKNFDYWGVFLMTLSLGVLEYVLEEGSRYAWFESRYIMVLTIVIVSSFIGLIIRELTFENPIIHLSAFKNRNFTVGCITGFILGIGLFGVVYVMPLFLFRVAGMDTLQIGIVMIVTGASQFCIAPIAGKMAGKVHDKRIMLVIGLIGFAFGCHLNAELTADSRFHEFLLPQIFRGASLMFCFIPINEMALGTMHPLEVQNASGLYNLMRNIGGAVGLATINTTIIDDTKRFANILGSHLVPTNPNVGYMKEYIGHMFALKVPNSDLVTLAFMQEIINRDAFIIALNDVFLAISALFLMALFLVPFFSQPKRVVEVVGH